MEPAKPAVQASQAHHEVVDMLAKPMVMFSLIVSVTVAFLFIFDLALNMPFLRPSVGAEILFVVAALATTYLSWETFREIS